MDYLGDPDLDERIILKLITQKQSVDWDEVVQDNVKWRTLLGSIKGLKFLGQLCYYELFKKNSTAWS
jgi:hypothetical protein